MHVQDEEMDEDEEKEALLSTLMAVVTFYPRDYTDKRIPTIFYSLTTCNY